ncbi:MAG: hypothetical protein F6K22_24565 [Okeania sp. SIO2F4]|uniref:hypothetical protein n=1 Tax=Okeania sp. SIO2F4 TaxID=2607790 RepID=UPI00142BD60F|nr:hypothetical protein [Okeania sp. SIO2F4]NES05705.1 hypothetical protein [Okeania sp. SIO2F4]
MLAFIGGLFAGIFGIFPFGKKSDYLLEFDDAKGNSAPKEESTQASVAAPAPTKTETKPASSETPKQTKAKLSAAKKAEKIAAAEAKKEAKAAKKAEKVEAQQPTAPQVAAPQPPITNFTVSQKAEEVVLFAPNFLMPKPTAKRRRPGPNMSMFRSMAKSMNLPR